MSTARALRVGPAPRLRLDVEGEGELVFFVHGIGGNRTNWAGQLSFLAKNGYAAAAMDLRGYGDSDDPDGPFDFADAADDIARIADHLGADRLHLCGLSMGGIVAMEFARAHLGRLHSLILCDTGPGIMQDRSETEAEAFLAARQKPLLEGLEPADIADDLARGLVSPKASPKALEILTRSMKALRKEGYLKALAAMARYRTPPPLSRVTVPALVIVGEDDRLTPVAIAEGLARDLPDSRLAVLPGAGHVSNIEAEDAFNATVLRFLAALPETGHQAHPQKAGG